MAHISPIDSLLKDAPSILDPSEVALILKISVTEVRSLSKMGAFEIFVPEADPDEECVLKSDLKQWLDLQLNRQL